MLLVGYCLSIVSLFNELLLEFFAVASPVLRVVMIKLYKHDVCVFLCVWGGA